MEIIVEQNEMPSTDELDLEIFRKFIAPIHNPVQSPLVMAVGTLTSLEGEVLRQYYKEKGYKREDVKIVGCNIKPFNFNFSKYIYDLEINHPLLGDASTDIPYCLAMQDLSSNSNGFDLVYIRNPDLINMKKWSLVFKVALENIESSGLVTTLIRTEDVSKYKVLLDILKNDYEIEPVVSIKTGIVSKFQMHDTVGIFRRMNASAP